MVPSSVPETSGTPATRLMLGGDVLTPIRLTVKRPLSRTYTPLGRTARSSSDPKGVPQRQLGSGTGRRVPISVVTVNGGAVETVRSAQPSATYKRPPETAIARSLENRATFPGPSSVPIVLGSPA